MYRLVESCNLLKGTKYKLDKIVNHGVYQGNRVIHGQLYFIFDKGTMRYYLTSGPFYEFISQQPQWKMEQRSVNLIMRRLIGDDCFEW